MSNHIMIRDRKRGGSRSAPKPRRRKLRPKTFKSEEAANNYAKKIGLKDYVLENIKFDSASCKKIRIITK